MNKKEILAEMLRNAGISALNKMQESMIKTYGGGGNVVLLSPTGSGKTLAYLLPLVLDLMERSTAGKEESVEAAVQAVVLVPSREGGDCHTGAYERPSAEGQYPGRYGACAGD